MAEGTSDAGDAMSLVGEPRRVAIVLSLVEHRREHPREPALSFSALHERSGIDDKGNFNYHLGRLDGHFVERTDDGYELTKAGDAAAGALLSAAYAERAETAVADESCPHCDAPVTVRLDAGRTTIRCENDHFLFETCLPPGAVDDRPAGNLLDLASLHWQIVVEFAGSGTCLECFGPEVGGLEATEIDGERGYRYRSFCGRCGLQYPTSPGALVVRHPAVVSLYHDHGVDLRTHRPWELDFCRWENQRVVSEEPLRLQVTAALGDDVVRVCLDRDGRVTDVEQR